MPWLVFVLVTLANLAGVAFRWLLATDPDASGPVQLNILRALPSFEIAALVGALVLRRRPGHGAGRTLLGVGGAFAILMLTESYAHYVLLTGRGWPGALAAAWVAHWLWIVVFAGLGLLLLLLPDGRPPTPRWRLVGWLLLVGTVALAVPFAAAPGPLDEVYPPELMNPWSVDAPTLIAVGRVGGWVLLGSIVLAGVSLIVRYRRSDALVRSQLRWVVAAGAAAAVLTVAQATIGQQPAVTPYTAALSDLSYAAFFAAIGVAILRHRLFDIDLVLNRAVVYTLVAAFVTGVYAALVIGVGSLTGAGSRGSLGLSLATAALVAVGFAPVRDGAQRLANRWIYGERQSPYELLRTFGHQLGATVSAEDLLPSIARAAVRGVAGRSAEARLKLPDGSQQAARWPVEAGPDDGPAYVVPINAGAEWVGQIAVTPRPGFPLTGAQRGLLDDLARQAGLACSNLRLTLALADQLETVSAQAAELRRSRQRLVEAQDAERRRLERDLHDGAQQQLVAVTLGLRAVADTAPDVAPQVEVIREQVSDTLATLRDLARGVFPPLLAEAGLVAALRAYVAKAGLAVTVRDDLPDGVRPVPDVEGALYFCAREALQNVAKHAGPAAAAVVTVQTTGDWLVMSVRDDGVGFHPSAASGSGLVNLSDRLAAVGGELRVVSASGRGTEVICTVPRPPTETP